MDNPYFDHMVWQVYPTELRLNRASSFDTKSPFLDLDFSINNGIFSSKIYNIKRDAFNFCFSLLFLWYIYFAADSFCKSLFKYK